MSLDFVDVGSVTVGGVPIYDPSLGVAPDYFSIYGAPQGVYDFGAPYIPSLPTIPEPYGAPQGDVRVQNFPSEFDAPYLPQQSIVPQTFSPDYFDLYSGMPELFQQPPAAFDPSIYDDQAIDGLFVDDATGAVVDASGRMVATPEEMARDLDLIDNTISGVQAIRSNQSLTPEQQNAEEQGLWSRLNSALSSPIGKVLATIGIGAAGLGIAELFTGGGDRRAELPAPVPPPAAVSSARDALNQAITTPGGVPSASLTGMLGSQGAPGGAPTVGSLASALGPGATAGSDLQDLFRLGIAGQRNIADIGLGRSATELMADVEQAPYERLIRMQALGELPGLLGPSAGVAPTIQTGLGLSQALQGLQAPQPGQTVNPAMLADPTRQALSGQIQSLLSQLQTPGGAEQPDAIRDQMRQRLQSLLSQGSNQPLQDPIRAQLAGQISGMLGTGGPAQGQMLDDPIRAGLEQSLQRALAGEVPTTALSRQFREEEAELRNRLFQSLGAGYETSSPGIEALQKLRESQQLRQEEFGRQTVASYAPQEFARRQFATQFPEQQYQQRLGLYMPQEFARRQFDITNPQQQYLAELGLLGPQEAQRSQFGQNLQLSQLQTLLPQEFSRLQFGAQFPETQYLNRLNSMLPAELQRAQFGEQVRQQGIANRADLTSLGRRPVGETAVTLGSIVPISPILGLDAEARERQNQNIVNQQAALASFNLDAQERARRAGAIGGIFGQAATALTTPTLSEWRG